MASEDDKKNVGTIAIVGGGRSSFQTMILRGLIAALSDAQKVQVQMNLQNEMRLAEVAFAKADRGVLCPYVKLERAGSSKHNYSADRRRAKKNRRSK